MKEIIEVRQYIDELIRRTLQGTIQWQKRSTSAYSWLKKVGEQTLQVSIQRARSVRVRQFYILNIIELPGTSLLTVDSSEDSVLNEQLQGLFEAIETSSFEKGLDAFKKLLDS